MLFPMDLSILHDQGGFRRHVIHALAQTPVDYQEQVEFIEKQRDGLEPWDGAGVLLPLYFAEDEGSEKDGSGQYAFLLNKRSKRVQQAGDLCAPGGGAHPFIDRLSQQILRFGLLPLARGPGFKQARQKGKATYKKILFFLGNALRESWEEIHLSPFNVEFLGALKTYRLRSRRWIIFPVVGRVKRAWQPKLSWEVEKIVPIPLQAFFLPENYAVYSLEVPGNLIAQGIPSPWEFPCLVFNDGREEEILWGATFNIIRSFLNIVFDHPLPFPDGLRVVHRPLVSNYFSGIEDP
jgi:8-oxo-dGTP pyrophosphatase MutT (NUDIX family)